MHRSDDFGPDRDEQPADAGHAKAEHALAVVDATLAGEAVEPADAELAELSLILAGQRPLPAPAFSAKLDERVANRFAVAPGSGHRNRSGRRHRSGRRWLYAPGAVVGLAAAITVVIVVSGGSSAPTVALPSLPNSSSHAASSAAPAETSSSASSAAAPRAKASSSAGTKAASPGAGTRVPSPGGALEAPAPSTNGRQVVQSAQLNLATRPDQVDGVAQQVFDVIAAQKGFVENSTVTANNRTSGYAQFQLSVPSANLESTMAALSRLQGASVTSRTDSSQDITGQLGGAGRRLADARALRTSLLRRLAAATTTAEIDSLQAQIRDAEASISSDLATLNSLHHQVDFSQISLAINASMAPGHPAASGGSFTIGRATHDAGRVLVIAAGAALIALAVLLPLGLVAALLAWVGIAVRRRRREQALDLI